MKPTRGKAWANYWPVLAVMDKAERERVLQFYEGKGPKKPDEVGPKIPAETAKDFTDLNAEAWVWPYYGIDVAIPIPRRERERKRQGVLKRLHKKYAAKEE